jgi:transcriptional/translational regulatory protein YebC/TACO1
VIHTDQKDLAKVRDTLKSSGREIVDAELTYVPNNTVDISDPETARKIIRLMDTLDDLDDVAATHTNFELAESLNVG